MDNTNWLRQTSETPLFPDILWSRPENRRHAGKLLIIGGNSHGFAAPAAAYSAALKAGIGTARVVLPDSLHKTVGRGVLEAEFAPSTPSGSFSRQALGHLVELSEWADGVLLAGDFGRNSETAVLLESFAQKYSGQLSIAQDAIDYFWNPKSSILNRDNSLLVVNLGKLQKIAKNNRPSTPVLHSMNLHELVTLLADWTNSVPTSFITKHADNLVVAVKGKVSTTPHKEEDNWQVELEAYAATWLVQQPDKPFEAITSANYDFSQV
jgi:hypothetical protein